MDDAQELQGLTEINRLIQESREVEATKDLQRAVSLLREVTAQIKNLYDEGQRLTSRVESLERKNKPIQESWLYGVLFAGAVLLTALLIYYGWAEKPAVNIEYNVGEIIGGLLVGVAALLASITYVRRSSSRVGRVPRAR